MTFHCSFRRENILAKLWSKSSYDYATGCWLWNGPTSGNGRGGGYGRVSINDTTCAVHIVSYTHFYGYLPASRQVDHKCNNRRCWNPDHLQLVTHRRNQILRAKRAKETT
jgi:hypothetical protein